MKRYIFAWLFLLTLLPVIPAAAEGSREVSTYLYREYTDCVFLVNWENKAQEAIVEITAPDGRVIIADDSNAEFGEGSVSVSVGNAESGYWIVRATGDALGAVSVSGGSRASRAAQYNAIQSFDVQVSGGYIHFKWDVISEQDEVNVVLNAWQGENGNSGSRMLWSDYSAPKSGSTSVSADELTTGLYQFSIQAYDGTGQYTLSTEEALYVAQSNAPDKVEGIKSGSIDGEMYISWDFGSSNGYQVTLYDYDTLAVLKSETVGNTVYPFSMEEGRNRVKFSVAAVGEGAYGAFDVYPMVYSVPAGTVVFPEVSVTREGSLAVTVDCPDNCSAGVYLDGKLLLKEAEAGEYDLSLAEGEHEIIACIEDENGNRKTFSKAVTVDRTPPAVNLDIPDSIQTNESSFTVTGTTEPNAVVAINGVEQELGTGRFTAKLELEKGINPVTVTAYDPAGNKSVKTVTVELTGDSRWTMFILPGVVAAVLAGWYIFLNRKEKAVQSGDLRPEGGKAKLMPGNGPKLEKMPEKTEQVGTPRQEEGNEKTEQVGTPMQEEMPEKTERIGNPEQEEMPEKTEQADPPMQEETLAEGGRVNEETE